MSFDIEGQKILLVVVAIPYTVCFLRCVPIKIAVFVDVVIEMSS